MGWIEFIAATAGLVPVGVWLWLHMRLRSRAVDLALLLVILAALVMAVTLVMGLSCLLHPAALSAVCVVAGVATAVAIRSRWREVLPHLSFAWPADKRLRIMLILAGGVAAWHLLRFCVHVVGTAPFVYDCLCYHLPRVAEWVQNGRIFTPDLPAARSYFAANFELLQAWCVVFPHHDVAIEAAGLPFFAVSVLSVYSMARSAGLSVAASVAAAVAASFAPGFLLSVTCGKNDIAVTSLLLFGFAVVLAVPRDQASRALVILVLVSGMGIGTKATFAITLPGLALLAIHKWFDSRRNGGLSGLKPLPLIPCAVVAAVAGLLASYWYLRNWAATGNPMYPAGLSFAGHTLFPPLNRAMQQGGFSLAAGWETVSELFTNRIHDGHLAVNPELGGQAGWGWFATVIGLPVAVFAFAHNRTLRLLLAAAAVSFVCLACCVAPDPWSMRFFTWVPAVMAVSAMAGIQAMRCRTLRTSMAVVAVAAISLDVTESASNGYIKPKEWARQFDKPWQKRATDIGQSVVSKHVPPGEAVGCFAEENNAVYPLYGPDFSRRVVYVRKPASTRDFAEEMRRCGVRFLFFAASDTRLNKLMPNGPEGHRLRKIRSKLYERTNP